MGRVCFQIHHLVYWLLHHNLSLKIHWQSAPKRDAVIPWWVASFFSNFHYPVFTYSPFFLQRHLSKASYLSPFISFCSSSISLSPPLWCLRHVLAASFLSCPSFLGWTCFLPQSLLSSLPISRGATGALSPLHPVSHPLNHYVLVHLAPFSCSFCFFSPSFPSLTHPACHEHSKAEEHCRHVIKTEGPDWSSWAM